MKTLEQRYQALRASPASSPGLVAAYAAVIADLSSTAPLGATHRRILEFVEQMPRLTFEELVECIGHSQSRVQALAESLCARGFLAPAAGGTSARGPWNRTSAVVGAVTGQGRPPLARARVARILSDGQARTRSEIVELSGIPVASVSAALHYLEVECKVRRLPERRWQWRTRVAPEPRAAEAGETTLLCEKREKTVTLTYCLDEFNEAHLRREEQSACFKCRQGAIVRLKECWKLPATPRRIEALFAYSLRADGPGRPPKWVIRELNLDPSDFEAPSEVSP